jgi:alpha-amylase/alpha-mannosidase (GH57 family)
MKKYLCIHAHFYQPPRENPWLEAIELQDSAHPYHDWNERIASECYAPNAAARIMDGEGRIERIVNNYSKISFNFGPTLLAWMSEKAPDILLAIVEADKLSREHYSGHGSALAQAYNHIILPLANRRDKYTQVLWGIREFQHRFGRDPEGIWLPETAADAETLDVAAELGIRFTILSPFQASGFRELNGQDWTDVNGGRIDPSRPYRILLPSGRHLDVFFYDGPVSNAVAFEHLLSNGEYFAQRLASAYSDARDWDQLAHIATDGESYGHHHWRGEMALAYALHHIESGHEIQLTNYAQFLELHPPAHEVRIHAPSSWSCPHGVERWRSHCGCNSGGFPGWNQKWRKPLREALDWLRDQLAPQLEKRGGELFKDPWQARNDYIEIILNRSAENQDHFFQEHAQHPLSEPERIVALKLLEAQRHALLMYTSCGWFFDELSGIETVQVIQYAGRAIQLAQELSQSDLESGFLRILGTAKCNVREHRDGRVVYEKFVKPAMVDMEKVGAHYAISSLFENYPEQTRIYSYTFSREPSQVLSAGRARLAIGRAQVTSVITRETSLLSFGAIHLGEHNLNGGVRLDMDPAEFQKLQAEIGEIFSKGELPEVIRAMDRYFGQSSYSLKSLFRDQQRKILNQILDTTIADLESRFRMITDRYTPLMRYLAGLGVPSPPALDYSAHFVVNADLRRQFESDEMDLDRVRQLLEESEASKVALNVESLRYALEGTISRMMERCAQPSGDPATLQRLTGVATIAHNLPFELNLWKTQNLYYGMLHSALPESLNRAAQGDEQAKSWATQFTLLGEQLGFRKNDPNPA